VIDYTTFKWNDSEWKGIESDGREFSFHPFISITTILDVLSFFFLTTSTEKLIIYEMHIGTFTNGGTWKDAIDNLQYLKALGVTALEIMPVSDFAGERNWGYDGVCLYAPGSQ